MRRTPTELLRTARRQPLRGGHGDVRFGKVVAGPRRPPPGARSRIPHRRHLRWRFATMRRHRADPTRLAAALKESSPSSRSTRSGGRCALTSAGLSPSGLEGGARPAAKASWSSSTSSRSCSASTSRATKRHARRVVRQPDPGDHPAARRADLRRPHQMRSGGFSAAARVHRAGRGVEPQSVLVPRAHQGPASGGGRAAAAAVRHHRRAPALVQRVLNDAGDDPDQLPVLQHVAGAIVPGMGTGRRRRMLRASTLRRRSGGIERALDRHGDGDPRRDDGGAAGDLEELFQA